MIKRKKTRKDRTRNKDYLIRKHNKKKLRKKTLKFIKTYCEKCGTENGELDVHHIIPLSKEENIDITNCQTLCKKCHVEHHKLVNLNHN